MIDLALAFHDADGTYALHAGAVIISVLKNTSFSCRVHIVHDEDLSRKSRQNLKFIAHEFGSEIDFYEVHKPDAQTSAILPPQLGIGSLYRLEIPRLLDCQKAIYLDCDICCNMDIRNLWDEPGDNGASDPLIAWAQNGIITIGQKDKHYNSGVMVMHLERLRRFFPDFRLAVLRSIPLVRGPLRFPDQDALNVLFQKLPFQILPEKYNFQLHVAARWLLQPDDLRDKILHYCGRKPWCEPSYPSALPFRENYRILEQILGKRLA